MAYGGVDCQCTRGGKPERPRQDLDSIIVYLRDHVLIPVITPVLAVNNNEDDVTR